MDIVFSVTFNNLKGEVKWGVVLHSFSPCSGEEEAGGLELRAPIHYTGIVMPNQALSACFKNQASKQAMTLLLLIANLFMFKQISNSP